MRLLLLDDHGFGREEERRDRRGVLQRRARDLRRVDNAGDDEIFVRVGQRVVTEVAILRGPHLLDHDRTFATGIEDDHTDRLFDRATDDVHADLLVFVELHGLECGLHTDERDAAAGDDAFVHCRARGVQCVLDASLLLLHFALGRGANVDHGHTARELRLALLELLLVVVARALLDRDFDFLDATLDLVGFAGAINDRRVVLIDDDALGTAEVGEDSVLQLEAYFFADHVALG